MSRATKREGIIRLVDYLVILALMFTSGLVVGLTFTSAR